MVTHMGWIETIQVSEFGGALFVVASNFRAVNPLSSNLKGLGLISSYLFTKRLYFEFNQSA